MDTFHLVFGTASALALTDDDKRIVDVLVIPDGKTRSDKGDFFIDESAFKAILASFKQHGVNIVIDYEHQTLGGAYQRSDGKAPAAGWIHSLRYEKGRGIIAEVEWTESARKAIRAGEYRYLSPVIEVRKSDRKAVGLQSAAVTNLPAIHGMERLAAKRKGAAMPKTKVKRKVRKGIVDLLGDKVRLVLQDVTPEEAAAVVEEVVEEIDEVGAAIAELKSALGLPDDTVALDVVKAAIEKLSGAGEGDGADETAAKGLKALKEALSLKGDATVEAMVAKIDAMQVKSVPASEHKALKDRLAAIEADRQEQAATTLVESLVADGKLNPNDKDRMEWANKRARADLTAFSELMEGAPKLYESDRLTDGATGGKSKRQSCIDTAVTEYKDNVERLSGVELWAYVNADLSINGHGSLSKEERTALAK